jgi:hypothetical protein
MLREQIEEERNKSCPLSSKCNLDCTDKDRKTCQGSFVARVLTLVQQEIDKVENPHGKQKEFEPGHIHRAMGFESARETIKKQIGE